VRKSEEANKLDLRWMSMNKRSVIFCFVMTVNPIWLLGSGMAFGLSLFLRRNTPTSW
jgi:hypothetical protein